MSRVKTFDSTGLATSGRIYAGDLNAIQDQYADITNLSQSVSVGSLAFGESGLILSRFGAGEGKISGAFRTDGVIRALGGLFAGTFTTTARDAIPAAQTPNQRPFGLVILNTTTNRLEINMGSDATPSWQPLGATISRGTNGSRPSASASNANSWYFSTDLNGGTLSYSDGSVWTKVAAGLTETPTIPTGTITSAMILDGTIAGGDMAAGAVGTTQLAAGSVTQAKFAVIPIIAQTNAAYRVQGGAFNVVLSGGGVGVGTGSVTFPTAFSTLGAVTFGPSSPGPSDTRVVLSAESASGFSVTVYGTSGETINVNWMAYGLA